MKKYVINKGKHFSSGWWLRFLNFHLNVNTFKFFAKLTPSCYWSPPQNIDDYEKNIICGVGFGINHNKNSIRIAWVPNFSRTNYFKLFAYYYDGANKHNNSIFLCEVEADQEIKIELYRTNNKNYYVYVNESCLKIDNLIKDKNWGFYLFPYFGGNNSAPL